MLDVNHGEKKNNWYLNHILSRINNHYQYIYYQFQYLSKWKKTNKAYRQKEKSKIIETFWWKWRFSFGKIRRPWIWFILNFINQFIYENLYLKIKRVINIIWIFGILWITNSNRKFIYNIERIQKGYTRWLTIRMRVILQRQICLFKCMFQLLYSRKRSSSIHTQMVGKKNEETLQLMWMGRLGIVCHINDEKSV